MKRQLYTVTITEETTRVVYVHAKSEAEAIELADDYPDAHTYTERTAESAVAGDAFATKEA